MQPMMILVAIAASSFTAAFPQYAASVPNGAEVPGATAIGHINPNNGGALNVFGQAFSPTSRKWTTALCQVDSDGDGAMNGEELDDPCCTWTLGAPRME
ncbi:Aste57867_10858 [Aphanomyces stellatus]|uniref:Aste57867_10858 protein n=1 Tax=Aphanomyces stellatus TaxID=120398 RepID=A0A485KS56_9STRA|nr:hypothetical protein As57867_010818 [Aphanomyces stellatus]VFT87726.1 Aste57867_10858 [Aphanomyces stellatus]